MQNSTEITVEVKDLIDSIRHLDAEALKAADTARGDVEAAVISAQRTGQQLDALKAKAGRRYESLILDNFGEAFVMRSKAYRKSVKRDTRQVMMSLGIVPDKDAGEREPVLLKPDPIFSWINKLTGKLRSMKTLPIAERGALRGLIAELERLTK